MSVIAAIFVGGGIGSVLRHLLSSQIGSHWGIMLVNVLGAMLIGMAYAYFADRASLRPETRAFIITGLLGGFTTFSTYMLDFNLLLGSRRIYEALFYLLGSVAVGIVFLVVSFVDNFVQLLYPYIRSKGEQNVGIGGRRTAGFYRGQQKKGLGRFEGLKTTDVYAGIGRSGRRKVVVDGAF